VFLHGVFFSASLWRRQLEDLGDLRRCLALDLLAHGESGLSRSGSLDVGAQSAMVLEVLDELGLEQVDLVGNDSGGAIAQLVVARAPERVRTLTLTNCDTFDNWPPTDFLPLVDLARSGALADVLFNLDRETALSSLSSGLEDPHFLSDAEVDEFFGSFRGSRERCEALERYVASMDHRVTVAIRDDLAAFTSPTLIVWGTGDGFFDVSWAAWLAATIPGTERVVELAGAKLLFPLERAEAFNTELRQFWTA
jgi:pimeloyl-ACP methyl ester carboxylesterase